MLESASLNRIHSEAIKEIDLMEVFTYSTFTEIGNRTATGSHNLTETDRETGMVK